MKRLSVIVLLTLPGCEDPQLWLGASISGDGVSVSPAVGGTVGGLNVAVSP